MVRVIIMGACGRMGREIIAVSSNDSDISIVGAVERSGVKQIGMDAGCVAGLESIGIGVCSELDEVIDRGDVIVDFTNSESSLRTVGTAAKHRKPVVLGTTGFSKEQLETIKEYTEQIPILMSPNMSQGVNILFHLVARAAELLGPEYDVEIVEIHHNLKKDAPSGTALRFGRLISEVRGKNIEDIGVFGRHGAIGKRNEEEIGIMALRLGDAVGDHTVIFGGQGERIEFTHRCSSRKNYAAGALRAAKFLVGKKRGLFGMDDVLGI